MPSVAELLDFELAWRRTKSDLQTGRVFVHTPFEVELIEADLKSWLDRLRQKIESGYQPESAEIADIPKGNGAVRPGAMLTLQDRVVYSALLGAALPTINAGLGWSQGRVDFAYRLSETPRRVEWFTNTFNAWTAFRNVSTKRIDDGAAYVVITDITGFYENVDLSILFSDLRTLGCPDDVTSLLSRCLNRWCVIPGRGLPQGLSASDILSKVYLNPVDRSMIDNGIDFIRYVDDIGIFRADLSSSKLALMILARSLRRRGLNLQSAKTAIHKGAAARRRIEGVNPLINKVERKYRIELKELLSEMFQSGPIPDEKETEIGGETPVEVIREVFRDHFLKEDQSNKTLLHFLLKRLADHKDKIAVDFCLQLFVEQPQETDAALNYLSAVAELPKAFYAIEIFLSSAESIYDFQTYQIFRWLNSLRTKPSDGLISFARQHAFDHAKPAYLRAVLRVILQEHGTSSDLEHLEGEYVRVQNDFERAQMLVNIRRMEAGRRNAFYGRVAADGFLCERASRLVKEGRL